MVSPTVYGEDRQSIGTGPEIGRYRVWMDNTDASPNRPNVTDATRLCKHDKVVS